MLNSVAGGGGFRLRALAVGNVAPGSDHLGRLAGLVAQQPLRVIHPAVAAVLLAETILRGVVSLLE